MPSYILPSEINQTGGLEVALVYVSSNVPSLFPGLLFLSFIAIMMTGFSYQERRNGNSSLLMWAAISSFITTTGALMLFLYPGIIPLQVISTCIAITFILVGMFLFSSDKQ